MVLPKYYCPTRWLGLLRATESIVSVWPLLVEYANLLVNQGYRPDRRSDVDDNMTEIELEDRANARLQEDEIEFVERVHEAEFHKWGEESWDLSVPDLPGGDYVLLPNEEVRIHSHTHVIYTLIYSYVNLHVHTFITFESHS